MLTVIILAAAALLALKNPRVQSWLANRFLETASESLGGEIHVDHIEVKALNKVHLLNLYIEDIYGDTLIFVPELTASIRNLNRRKKIFVIGKMVLERPELQLRVDSSNIVNLKYFVDELKKAPSDSGANEQGRVEINHIQYNMGKFSLQNKRTKSRPEGSINFTDLLIEDINITASQLQTLDKGVSFKVEEMDCKESTGFDITNFSSEILIKQDKLHFTNNKFLTSASDINAPAVNFDYKHSKDFRYFNKKVRLKVDIKKGELDSRDLAFFIPGLSETKERADISGLVYGKISSLHGRKLHVNFGDNSSLKGKFDFSGLPDAEDSFGYINMEELLVGKELLDVIGRNQLIKDPDLLDLIAKLGDIKFKGVFTGFKYDFVSYGKFESDLGMARTDLAIKPGENRNVLYEGKLNIEDFELGSYTGLEEYLGKISAYLGVNGSWSAEKGISSDMEALIHEFDFNKYKYQNIEMSGILNERYFNGSATVDDPNLKMDFLGLLDFSLETPEFDFTLNVPGARLGHLNFTPSDSTAELSLLLTANFAGQTVDDFNGSIRLLNSRLRSRGKTLEAYNFSLEARNSANSGLIFLETDYFDAKLIGDYEFKLLAPSVKYLQWLYLPGTMAEIPDTTGIHKNRFEFELLSKDTDKLSDFFYPSLRLDKGSLLKGKFDPSRNKLELESHSGYIDIGEHRLIKPVIKLVQVTEKKLRLNLMAEQLSVDHHKITIDTLAATSTLENDSLRLSARWGNSDSITYRGTVGLLAGFRKAGNKKTGADITLLKSRIIHRNNSWLLDDAIIKADSTAIEFRELSLSNNEKLLAVDGIISEQPEDTLSIRARGLRLDGINLLNRQLSFGGKLKGVARLSNLYNKPIFLADMRFENLNINDVSLGNSEFSSRWDPASRTVQLDGTTEAGIPTGSFNFTGGYIPGSGHINIASSINTLSLEIFKPFVRSFSSELNGRIKGTLMVKGAVDEPVISARLGLENAMIKVDASNTSYSFTDIVEAREGVFYLDDIIVHDELGNTALANGRISARNFKKLYIDLDFQTDKIQMLNLKEEHNDLFYGNITGSGSVSLKGAAENLSLKIAGKTRGNSEFFLPLDKGNNHTQTHYVEFIEKDDMYSGLEKHLHHKKPEPSRKQTNLDLNINMETTPELETTLFFDPTAGGSLTTRGISNLRINSGTSGDFNIYGEYTIDHGIYNFKLSHILNKKFVVKNGSKIVFTGKPDDAQLDVVAIYKVRTSLYNLYYDEAYRRRIPVNCEIYLTGKLESPNISFNIDLPTADEETKTRLKNTINTEEDLSKQFLSLIIINSFLPDPSYAPQGSSSLQSSAMEVTTAELLSSQLSSWLSQISNDFDIGFRYRPGDEVTSQEIELAIATQLLNDRVHIDVGGNQQTTSTNPNEVVGHVSVEVKVDKSGKLRLKAFTRPNDKMKYEEDVNYETGVGIFFREEFDSFGELLKDYWGKLFKRKEKREERKKRKAKKKENTTTDDKSK